VTTFYVREAGVGFEDPHARRTAMVEAHIGRDSGLFLERISQYSFVSLDLRTAKKAWSTDLR
jgi:hypothetical protein